MANDLGVSRKAYPWNFWLRSALFGILAGLILADAVGRILRHAG